MVVGAAALALCSLMHLASSSEVACLACMHVQYSTASTVLPVSVGRLQVWLSGWQHTSMSELHDLEPVSTLHYTSMP
jgi:hypothetical protein